MGKSFLISTLLGLILAGEARAQSMPVVFDKRYGENSQIQQICFVNGSEIALTGKKGEILFLSWLHRDGRVAFTRTMTGFTEINRIKGLDDGRVLVVGQSARPRVEPRNRKNKNDETAPLAIAGRVVILDRDETVHADFYVGEEGASLLQGEVTRSGNLLLAGHERRRDGQRRGILVKVTPDGKNLYKYISPAGSVCTRFEVLGNAAESVCAAFSSDGDAAASSVVRLDNRGKPYYTTILPAREFTCTGINARATDGSTLVVGHSPSGGGIIYKIRPEGDIVFTKTIVPSAGEPRLEFLDVSRDGTILAGGNDESHGYYVMLRDDGTNLFARRVDGSVTCLRMNPATGESIVATFDPSAGHGSLVKLSGEGKVGFEKGIDGLFEEVRLAAAGEVTLLSRAEGRISHYSPFGELLSDGYISGKRASSYDGTLVAPSGELLFWGAGNHLVKLGHGLYVSDVKITKPVNGLATALFTVTLTGFATGPGGVALPVNVSYETRPGSANETHHFVPVSGRLSFIPAKGETNRYQVKQEIEVPVMANDRVEGTKEFEVRLSGAEQGYLIKPAGRGIIEDQQAIVKLVRVEDGVEGSREIDYRLGLFKTDGRPLVNATSTDIILDGAYGEGTADALDFDASVPPRVVIPDGHQAAGFSVKTLSDTRYELPKTVVVNFNKIHALSGARVAFEGALLACRGTVIDQPATLVASALGDRRANHNVVSGFFNLSLRRASDGASLTNTTGDDIVIHFVVDPESTAIEGKDFVLTNQHDLRVDGNGNHGSVNLSGVVLHNPGGEERVLKMSIDSVTAPAGAVPITIDPRGRSARFSIKR
ncbi:MAG: hypothetical protein LBP56_10070 [Odoribacteraceae bacterium]|jgi:hypothetical protein|nr:hypothetical protein [Odoribacteraceae bacterium]